MDVNRILAALRLEREQLDAVILNLEHLAQSREHRRGRPPAIFAAARKRGRPGEARIGNRAAGVRLSA